MKSTSFLIACILLVMTAACGHSVETAAPEPVEPVQNKAAVTIVTDPVAANQKEVTEEGVAFIARVNGQTDIFFLSLDGSTLKNLTNDNLREDYFEWTPNGAQITYRVALTDDQPFGAPFQNWIMNADGSGKRLLRDCPIGCSPIFWAPDGQKMAIIVTESLTPPQVAVALGDRDGNVKTIVSIYGSVIEQFWWSPNSTKLAYTVINEDRSETLIVLNTTGMYTNYSASSSGRILPIGWSYDSSRLLYIEMSTAPVYHLYSFLTGEDIQLPKGPWLLGWLADGNLYGLSSDKTDVVSVPPQGGEPALRMDFFLEIEGIDIAPNGSHAVVRPYLDRDRIQKGEIPDTELYLLTREGYSSLLEPEMMPGLEQINRLALRPSGDHRVPDTQYSITPEPPEVETNTDFAFIAKINGQEDIFLSNAEQGSIINLTNDPAREESYDWSPDGSLIIYRVINYGADGKYQSAQLWSVRPDGTEKKMLLDCPNQCSNAAFSPDGSLIAVLIISSIDGGLDQIDIMRPDGSERRTIMRGLNWTSPLIWSPDSRMVAAQQINTDGMRPIAVYQFDSDSVYFYSITATKKNLMQWSPSGDEMLYFDTTVSLVPHILSLDDESDRILEVDGIPFRWRKDGTLLGGDTHAQSNSIFTVRADGSNYKTLYSFPWYLFGWDLTENDDLIFVPEAVSKEQEIEPGIYRALPGNEPVKVIGAQEIPGLESIRMVLWRHRD